MNLNFSDDVVLPDTTDNPHREFASRLRQLQRDGYQIIYRDDERLEATIRLQSRYPDTADTWQQVWIDTQGTFHHMPTINPAPRHLDD